MKKTQENKFFQSLKVIPTYLMKMAEKTNEELLKYEKESVVLDTEPEAVQLELMIKYAPQKIKSDKIVVYSWNTHCEDHDAPYMTDQQIDHRVLDFSAPYVICLNWSVLNAAGEKLWLDINEAIRYEQTFELTPRMWNDLRRSRRIGQREPKDYLPWYTEEKSQFTNLDVYFDVWMTRLSQPLFWNVFEVDFNFAEQMKFSRLFDRCKYSSLSELKELHRNIHKELNPLMIPSAMTTTNTPDGVVVVNLRRCYELNLMTSTFIFNSLI